MPVAGRVQTTLLGGQGGLTLFNEGQSRTKPLVFDDQSLVQGADLIEDAERQIAATILQGKATVGIVDDRNPRDGRPSE